MDASGPDSVAKVMKELAGEDADARVAASKWKFTVYENGWQKWAFRAMVSLFVGFIIVLATAWQRPSYAARLASVLLLLAFQLAGLTYCVTISLPEIRKALSFPLRAFLGRCLDDAERGRSRVIRLARFTEWELAFVEEHLALDTDHLKARRELLIGPVGKVGLLASFAGAFGMLYKVVGEVMPAFRYQVPSLGLAVFSIFGVVAFRAEFLVHRVEDYRLLLRSAMKLKDEKEEGRPEELESAPPGDGPPRREGEDRPAHVAAGGSRRRAR